MPRPTAAERASKPAAAALSHPLRVRILAVLSHRDMSPSQFVAEDLGKGFFEGNRGLSQVSYHFRELALAGCLEVVDLIPVRGAMEHVYRATRRAHLSHEEWEATPLPKRKAISSGVWQSIIAAVESAILAGTFDRSPDRHLTWIPMDLDQQGWEDLCESQQVAFLRAEEIRKKAAERLAEADKPVPMRATVAHLAFESPPSS